MIDLNEFYIDKNRGHPIIITTRVNKKEVWYMIYCDGYLEPKTYKAKPKGFLKTYTPYEI